MLRSIFEVFYQPGKLFASLPQRPRAWLAALLADILLLVATSVAVTQLIGVETLARTRLAGAHGTPEQIQHAIERMSSPGVVFMGYCFTGLTALLTIVIIAFILMILALIRDAAPDFPALFSMAAHALLPYWLLMFLLTLAAILSAPNRAALDPATLIHTSAAVFVNQAAVSKFAWSLLQSLDLLTFLAIGLLSLGFARVTRSTILRGLLVVTAPWLVLVVFRAVATGLF